MFSGILTDNDLERDPGKIEAIEEMPKSQILDDAQHLNSFATYLSNFMPELSDGMKPLSAVLPSLHDYNVKLPNFTFCRRREQKTITFFFLNFDTVL